MGFKKLTGSEGRGTGYNKVVDDDDDDDEEKEWGLVKGKKTTSLKISKSPFWLVVFKKENEATLWE